MEAIKSQPVVDNAAVNAEIADLRAMITGERTGPTDLATWIRNKPVEQSVSEFIHLRYPLAYTLQEYFEAVQVWHAKFQAEKEAFMKAQIDRLSQLQSQDPAAFAREMKERMEMHTRGNDRSLLVSHYRSELKKHDAVH